MEDQKQIERKAAQERAVEQFRNLLDELGLVIVDCGEDLGHVLIQASRSGRFGVNWINGKQLVKLDK